jgi:hypothetical protein
MAALARSLSEALPRNGVPSDAVRCVVEIVQAEADQLRLMLDGGAPWETVRTEQKMYEVLHGDAPAQHRLFRGAAMLAALLMPPRWFYQARGWLGSRPWYQRAREKTVPVPKITRVAGPDEFKA